MLVLLGIGCLIMAGMMLIYGLSDISQGESNWDGLVRSGDVSGTDDQGTTLDWVKLVVYGGASCALLLAFMSSAAMSNVRTMVNGVKAAMVRLQSVNIAQLPLGVALVAAAVFLADTAASADAPLAAFAVFVLGAVMVAITLIGCFGASIQSRGILRLYMLLTGVLSLLFIAFGLVSIFQADRVESYLSSRWDTVRKVLPSTFSGKYDKEQFQRFVASNLLALGYLSLCTALLLGMQWRASITLRAQLKMIESIRDQGQEVADSAVRTLWKQNWTHGSRGTRCLVKAACACGGVFVLAVVTLSALALYFSTSCSTLGSYSETRALAISAAASGTGGHAHTYDIVNGYKRGVVQLTLSKSATAVTGTVTKTAFESGRAGSEWPTVSGTVQDGVSVVAQPSAPDRVLGFDVSCKGAQLGLELPFSQHFPAAAPNGTAGALSAAVARSYGTPAVELAIQSQYMTAQCDWTGVPEANRPAPSWTSITAGRGGIELNGYVVGAKGGNFSTELGDVSLTAVRTATDPLLVGQSQHGINVVTSKGAVFVQDSVLTDTDCVIQGSASLLQVQSTNVQAQHGGSLLAMSSDVGVLQLLTSSVDLARLRTAKGRVYVSDSVIRESLRIATVEGQALLNGISMGLRGTLQVESTVGNIVVHLSEFAGYISVATGGTISCSGDGFDTPAGSSACPVTTTSAGLHIVEQVTANCAAAGDCAYTGEVVVTSEAGNVQLVIDAVNRST